MATTRQAHTVWEGNLAQGKGLVTFDSSGIAEQPVSWASRAEQANGKTSPEELIAAAHSSCFSMALSNGLTKAGTPPTRLTTQAEVTLVPGTGITGVHITVQGVVEGLAHRAVLLGVLSGRDEPGLVQTRHGALHGDVDAGDAGARLEGHFGLGVQLGRRVAGLGESVRESHGEAAGMSGGDQLFRAGLAVRLLGTRRPGDRVLANAGGVEGHNPLALEQVALPDGVRLTRGGHDGSLQMGWYQPAPTYWDTKPFASRASAVRREIARKYFLR